MRARAVCSEFVGITELKAGKLMTVGSDDLDPHRQALFAEAGGYSQGRTARHGDEKHGFHPFVIARHLVTSSLVRPAQIYVERK